MNILKNFEALFVVTLGLACAANYVTDSSVDTQTAASITAPAAIAQAQDMQVVVVSAKRLNPEQKKQSLIEEQNASLAQASRAVSKI